MLNGEERFDALKTMLQLNTFTNAVGLASALSAESTRIHLYHSPFDRLVPQQNSLDLADVLLPGFDATAHFDACDSNAYEELGNLIDQAGVGHLICAFEMFDRVLLDLRSGEEARTGRLQGALPGAGPRAAVAGACRAARCCGRDGRCGTRSVSRRHAAARFAQAGGAVACAAIAATARTCRPPLARYRSIVGGGVGRANGGHPEVAGANQAACGPTNTAP